MITTACSHCLMPIRKPDVGCDSLRPPSCCLAGEICDLRRVILHMIEETARHANHLDIARELADNRTGLGQRYARRVG